MRCLAIMTADVQANLSLSWAQISHCRLCHGAAHLSPADSYKMLFPATTIIFILELIAFAYRCARQAVVIFYFVR